MCANATLGVSGTRGGTGKTTTNVDLGAAIGDMGYATVIVAFDPDLTTLVDVLDLESNTQTVPTLHDVLAGTENINEAIYEVDRGLDLLTSGTPLEDYAGPTFDRLSAVLEELQRRYDVLLLDLPAELGDETIRPIRRCDGVIVVSTAHVSAVRNARSTIRVVERTATPITGLIVTETEAGASSGAGHIADSLGVGLLGGGAVPLRADATPVVRRAPRSDAAAAYRQLARDVVDATIDADSSGTPCETSGDGSDRTASDGSAEHDAGPIGNGSDPI
jgi:septum site-determining protein MinD